MPTPPRRATASAPPVPIDDGLREAIDAWRAPHPLARLREAFEAHVRGGETKRTRDVLAEAMIARHLLERGATLRSEIPTPAGRTCDFEVRFEGWIGYLHVKRLATGADVTRQLTISSRLRALEQVPKPYVVGVRWRPGTTDRGMQQLVREAEAFIRRASIGDELVVRDERTGREIGGVLVVAPWDGPRVSLVIGLPEGFADEAPRIRRLLKRAYEQFMPRATNLVVLATSRPDDRVSLQEALLGAHEERWDAFPKRGRRRAFGRAADGFWSERRYEASQVAGWFLDRPAVAPIAVDLLFRESPALPDVEQDRLRRLFI